MNNETRVHRVTVWCKFGNLVARDLAGDTFSTGAKASKAMRELSADVASSCGCHGCQLDKVGR